MSQTELSATAAPSRRSLRRALAVLLAVVVGVSVVAIDIARFPAFAPADATADAALVLGAAVWGDDPSPVFAARLDHALDLYRQQRVRRVLVTGGTRDSTQLAESIVGRRYLEARGVPAAAIAGETQSNTTWQNLVCIRPAVGHASVLIVSDPLHLRRALRMAQDLGLDAQPAATPTSRYQSRVARSRFLLRETVFQILDAVASATGRRGACPSG